ncbi:MAG: hypothetical protein LBQ81_14220, partial [Zoogloeaceae bacterium]|nr:hypothetical protein [Zoogloeaceae bacterium]
MYGNSNDGGATANTAPSDNIVNIGTGGHVTDNVYGAFTNDASANVAGNTVTINGNGSTASDPVNNSGDYFSVYGGVNNDTNASSSTVVSGNRVVIDTSGTVDSYVWGGFGQGSAQVTDNHVTVTNTNSGTITGALVGGRGNSGEVSGNSVTLQGTGNVGTGPGGEKSIRGGYATGSGGNAIGNAVYIGKDANGVGDYTGTIYSGAIWGGGVSLGDANGNTINISGGTFINTQIHAGYLGSTSSGTAINNIVTIEGTPSFSGVGLYGGFQANNSSFASDLISGNTLNLKTSVNIKNLKNFQYLNFYLPTTLANGGAMLTIESGGTADITDSIVNVGIDGRASPLAVGNTVKLIDASVGTLTGAPVNNTANGTGMQGVTLRYAFDIQATNKQLLAKVTSIRADETSKALVEGFLSGTAFLNQGADFVVHEGLSAALAARRA